ncbi:MAG: FAD-dependent oxidoreductase [Candidatus Omnitrophota bacterium]
MKKIVIIGNSAAGIAAAEAIRQHDKESRLTILTDESFAAYERPKLLGYLEGKIKEKDLYLRTQDFYKNNNIELLLEKEVVDLSTKKRVVHCKDKTSIEFDELVIASGTSVKFPSMKGTQKEGVVGFSSLKDVKFILENLPIAHTVVIVGRDPLAAVLAQFISARKIEVKYFGVLEEAVEGVDVVNDNPIVEILGEGEARAVRLANQKVIGASLIIFTSPREPNIDFLRDTDVKTNKGILVDAQMRTNIPCIFAVGDVSEVGDQMKTFGWEYAQKEGQMLGGILCQI